MAFNILVVQFRKSQWIPGLILFMIVLLSPIPLQGQSFAPSRCLSTSPVNLEECFREFLESGLEDISAWFNFVEEQKNKGTLYYNQETGLFRIHKDKPQEKPFKQQTVPERLPAEETLLRRESRKSVEVPYLSSGGWINVLTFRPFLDGHIDVTKRVLARAFKFNYAAQKVAADASKDPDFYAWTIDAAHAQTPADRIGRVDTTNLGKDAQAIKNFGLWLSNNIKSVKRYCDSEEVTYALYALGYSLHAVQDLAAHNGRTFAEHSWNSYCPNVECDNNLPQSPKEGDPDDDESNIALAELYSIHFLSDVRDAVGYDCWTKMKFYDGPQLSWSEKRTIFKLEWSLSLKEYLSYREARFAFAKSNKGPEYKVRWLVSNADRADDGIVSTLWKAHLKQ